MAKPLSELVSEIRIMSGLMSNQWVTDPEIAQAASDCWKDLYDRFVAVNQHYRIKTFEFTLTAGQGNNSVDLPSDFQLGNGLELNPSFDRPWSVAYLSSWLNRNNLGASILNNSFMCPDNRAYCFNDGQLIVYPASLAAGDYKLYYTPMADSLAATKTVTFDIDAADVPAVPPPGSLIGNGAWILANATTPSDLPDSGFDLILDFDAPNESFSGTYPVVDVGRVSEGFGNPTFAADNLVSTSGFMSPAAGAGTYTYQPVGTISELPDYADPWQLYIKLQTSIWIREGRGQEVNDLDRRFQQQVQRVDKMLQNRQEEATQPPLTRDRGFWDTI